MKYDYVKLNPSEQIGPHSQAAVLPGFEPVVAGIIGMQDSLEFHGASKAALARLLLQMENENQAERTASVLRILSLISRERDVSVSGRFRKAETAVEKIRKAGMSRTRFCSFWRHETGETFMTFVTRQRLKTACHLLLTRPGMHVSEICYESGFSDIPHFNRTFRRFLGLSPTEYRTNREPR